MTTEPRRAAHEALDALLDALQAAARTEGSSDGPERLLGVDEAARAAGIGRSLLYGEIAKGRVRTIRIGRRRLVPESAIQELGSRAPG
jgi:excisionase family DNA binding protein